MKTYFYGTSKLNNKKLLISETKDNKIYLTDNRLYALMYASVTYINLFIDDGDGKLKFFNIVPDLFKKLYKDKIAYIYSLESDKFLSDAPDNRRPLNDLYFTLADVTFKNLYEVIIFDEFMKLKEDNKFRIVEKEDIPNEYIEGLKKYYKNRFDHNDMIEEEIEFFNTYLAEYIK